MHAGAARLAMGTTPEERRPPGRHRTLQPRGAGLRCGDWSPFFATRTPDRPHAARPPGLSDLPHAGGRRGGRGGLTVDVETEGDLDGVPSGVSLAAYRVVQEALTNVVRHAGQTRPALDVRAEDDRGDPGRERQPAAGSPAARPSSGGGHGTIGMRERLELYGGTLSAGPSSRRRLERRGAAPLRACGPMIRAAIADDQPLVRAGLRALFEHAEDITVVGEAGDGGAAVEVARASGPGGADGHPDAADGRHRGHPADQARPGRAEVSVLILTTFDARRVRLRGPDRRSQRFPAQGCTAGAGLRRGPSCRSRGGSAGAGRHPPAHRNLRPASATPAGDHRLLAALTDREREVVALVGRGLSNADISARWWSARPPPRPMCRGRWPSCTPATARSWSCWPTRAASSIRAQLSHPLGRTSVPARYDRRSSSSTDEIDDRLS